MAMRVEKYVNGMAIIPWGKYWGWRQPQPEDSGREVIALDRSVAN